MIQSKACFIVIASALLLLSVFLHFWKIGEIPPGFYWDEVSISYNAYCLAETGKDEEGNSFPLFFKSFTCYYGDPEIIYSLSPIVKIFGLSKAACRSVSAFYLICASIFFVFLSYAYARNKWIALAAGFLFSILPWVFPTSRTIMIGYSPMLLGIIAGWFFLIRAIGKNNWSYAVIAGGSWSMVMYCYSLGRPFSAIAMIVFVLAFNFLLVKRIKIFSIFILSYFCASIPLIIAVINNPAIILSRFDISVWSDGAKLHEVLNRILVRYAEYFSPDFLFVRGDPELRHNAGCSGELYIFMAPFIIAGFYCVIRKFRRNPYFRFLLYAIVIYPAAAVLTMDRMHSTRCMNGAPFWCLLAAVGFYFIWTFKPKFRIAAIAVMCFATIEISQYFVNYFGKYALDSRGSFYASFSETVEYAFKNLSDNETFYVSDSVFFLPVDKSFKPYWYIYFLFYGKISPATYQKNGLPEYIRPYDGRILNPGIFIRMNSRISVDGAGNPIAVENSESVPENSKLIHKIPVSAGSDRFFEIYRVR